MVHELRGSDGRDRGGDRHRRSRRSPLDRPPSRPPLRCPGRPRQRVAGCRSRAAWSRPLATSGRRRGHRSREPPTAQRAHPARGCEVLALPGRVACPIVPLLRGARAPGNDQRLGRRRGQPSSGSFFDEGQVDAVEVYIAPLIEGGDHARTAVTRSRARCMSDVPRVQSRKCVSLRRRPALSRDSSRSPGAARRLYLRSN